MADHSEIKEINLYESHQKIYPREVKGFFSSARWFFVWLTQIIYYATPWISFNDRQAILFDLENRRFFLFNLVLYPQDLIYLTGLLIISALSLFLFTAVAGRLWCGYTCPQTVYTEIFQWIENKVEGSFLKRKELDTSNWNIKKVLKKGTKHCIWLLFAFWTGFTFSGYFTPIKPLFINLISLSLSGWSLFWILFYSFATYGNAGFMREQVCKYMCPYARFQSAMLDDKTLIISYDAERGEPRGKLSGSTKSNGDCIDCNICVQVCPTGIDIRKGLQYECIGCAACIDACDQVMSKVNKPKGLIKYTSEFQIKNKHIGFLKSIFRPRILIYCGILITFITLFVYAINFRPSFRVDIVKDRSVLSRIDKNGNIENIYRMQFMNLKEYTQSFLIDVRSVNGLIKLDIEDEKKELSVPPAATEWFVIHIETPYELIETGKHRIEVIFTSKQSSDVIVEKTTFIVPRK